MSNKRTGNYNNYVRLLNKYKARHPAEIWSRESYNEESKNIRIKEYLNMSEWIMDEMKLGGTQRRDLKHMLKTIPLKSLHRQAKAEVIIICLCIYIRRVYNNRNFRWQEYKIVKDYGLTCFDVLTVVTNLCKYYSERIPLPYAPPIDKHGDVDENFFQ